LALHLIAQFLWNIVTVFNTAATTHRINLSPLVYGQQFLSEPEDHDDGKSFVAFGAVTTLSNSLLFLRS
jgi:hypothetical protein